MYFAMVQYYILLCPYPAMILIFVTEGYIPIGIVLWILPFGIKKLIRGGQWCLYQVSRVLPALQDICGKMDSGLNSWGLWLEGAGDIDDEAAGNDGQRREKRIPIITIYVCTILAAGAFLIAPYYLEPELAGNSQRVCANVNRFMEEKIARVQEFVDRYYMPKLHEEEIAEETGEIDEEAEERILLHLGDEWRNGAYLRSSPEILSDNIVDTVYGDVELVFENEMKKTENTIWVKVSTDEIPEAWISRKLIKEELPV